MKRTRQWIQNLVLGSAAVAMVIVVGASVFRAPPEVEVGTKVPVWQGKRLDGVAVGSDTWQGKPIVLNFWGSFCPPCVEETPLLQRMSTQYPDVAFVGINLGEKPTVRVQRFVEEYGVTYPIVVDPQLAIRDLFRVVSYPTTFFIDRSGTIRSIVVGGLSEAVLTARIAMIVRGSGGKTP